MIIVKCIREIKEFKKIREFSDFLPKLINLLNFTTFSTDLFCRQSGVGTTPRLSREQQQSHTVGAKGDN